MSDAILKVEHLQKLFPVKTRLFSKDRGVVHAVDGVSFEIRPGETFGLVGESGCGKSTLSRTILNLTPAGGGAVFFHGKDITNLPGRQMDPIRQRMRMIFQKPYGSLNPRERVRDIISAPLKVHHLMPEGGIESEVLRLMDLVGLNREWLDRYPHEFSGGQRQRIGIARALAGSPEFIICDEPVSALDVSIQSQILNLLKDLQQELGLTYLFISHNLSVVKFMADRIAVMYLGVIVELADSEDLYEHASHPYTKALLSAIPEARARSRPGCREEHRPDCGTKSREMARIILSGDLPNPINPPSGCRFSTRCPLAEARCQDQNPPLLQIRPGHYCACFLAGKGGG